MLDIRFLRENPDLAKQRLALRNPQFSSLIDQILDCDAQRRQAETRYQQLQAERKRLSKQIGQIRAAGGDSSTLEEQARTLGEQIEALQKQAAECDSRQRQLLLITPNLPHEQIPVGSDSSANPVVREYLTDHRKPTSPNHLEIASQLQLLDLDRAAKISGSGFTCFTHLGARLERALINFLLDLHSQHHGYREISPPFLIRRDSMIGTGQLPKFEEDMYACEKDDLFLAPTAEVPLTNLYRDEILPISDLPIRLVAYSPCFRREAGSTGRETRGIIRLHQFDKVELVKICRPEDSPAELESLTNDAERVLQLLQIPYRVVELCSGDLGFSSMRTYDIEVWSPGQAQFLEVSSCSNFGDYQARRMNLRFKDSDGKNRFCHTLNGSGTALPRLFVALIENHFQ
ncbi:MAG: serine--tRNA ligase, partial [Chthoniobacterales bacterium]|nr:serine--tRNA ligase [Chthoniobacterales bacterium]